jgi:quercetin dioxygenase-like cupin family protein
MSLTERSPSLLHAEEGIFVLEGRYRFQLGDQQLELGPGDFVHVPRPTPHAFEALEPGRALVIVAPGGFHGRQGREGDAEQRACCREFVGELFL